MKKHGSIDRVRVGSVKRSKFWKNDYNVTKGEKQKKLNVISTSAGLSNNNCFKYHFLWAILLTMPSYSYHLETHFLTKTQ